MIKNLVKTMAVVGAVALSFPAFAGGVPAGVLAINTVNNTVKPTQDTANDASNDTTVKGDDTVAVGIGFPSYSNSVDCTNTLGFVWNLYYQTTDSDRCVENDEADAVMFVLNGIGDTPGEALTGPQLGALNRVALMSEKNCRALQSMPGLGEFIINCE